MAGGTLTKAHPAQAQTVLPAPDGRRPPGSAGPELAPPDRRRPPPPARPAAASRWMSFQDMFARTCPEACPRPPQSLRSVAAGKAAPARINRRAQRHGAAPALDEVRRRSVAPWVSQNSTGPTPRPPARSLRCSAARHLPVRSSERERRRPRPGHRLLAGHGRHRVTRPDLRVVDRPGHAGARQQPLRPERGAARAAARPSPAANTWFSVRLQQICPEVQAPRAPTPRGCAPAGPPAPARAPARSTSRTCPR